MGLQSQKIPKQVIYRNVNSRYMVAKQHFAQFLILTSDFGLKIVILFGPLTESTPARRENFDFTKLAWKVSSIALFGSGYKN